MRYGAVGISYLEFCHIGCVPLHPIPRLLVQLSVLLGVCASSDEVGSCCELRYTKLATQNISRRKEMVTISMGAARD